MLSKLTVNNQSESLKEYRLPSIVSVEKDKRSILDSLDHNRACRLPTYNQLEKFTPAAQRVVSITDPNPLQRIIDQGAPVVKKEARQMSTIRIRRKKMKKHQLRRLRKRMRFLMRKLKAVKLKKKEKRMQEYEKEKKRWADEFDAEKVIDEHLVKARDCGWGIDILAERAVRRGMMAAAGGSSSNKPSDK
jgi:6-pyruvoyl-tetrahydropterin synthase